MDNMASENPGLMKLLVVDDEMDMAEYVKAIADTLGFEAEAVGSFDAFSDAYSVDTKVIVLDLFMPGFDGIELIRFLGSIHSKASLVLMTGMDKSILNSAQELAQALGLRVIGSVQKPFRKADLKKVLDRFEATVPQVRASSPHYLPDAEELAAAIDSDQITLAVQPQISFTSRRFMGVEALARWQHPVHGTISPGHFIPLAERTGLIDRLTDQMLRLGLDWLAMWENQGMDTRLSVNMSPVTLKDLELPDRLAKEIINRGLSADQLVIEVTETALMTDLKTSLDILARLRMKGIHLSIDDFGTGYSSMRQLVRAPFDELKVDKTFVRTIDVDPECKSVAKAAITLAHELGMRVVAEGIETEAAWRELRDLGCDEGQGFLLGRPMPAKELADWLEIWNRSRELQDLQIGRSVGIEQSSKVDLRSKDLSPAY